MKASHDASGIRPLSADEIASVSGGVTGPTSCPAGQHIEYRGPSAARLKRVCVPNS